MPEQRRARSPELGMHSPIFVIEVAIMPDTASVFASSGPPGLQPAGDPEPDQPARRDPPRRPGSEPGEPPPEVDDASNPDDRRQRAGHPALTVI